MSDTTAISWCDSTFNPWIGCEAISPACKNCYAAAWAKRYGRDFAARTHTSAANWKLPLRWEREHAEFFAEYGRRRRVFCASLADVFDNQVPPAWRAELFALIASTPHLDWLLLTKRIGNVPVMLEAPGMQKGGLPSNVWLGATVVTQAEADRDIPKLLATPAAVRFLSMEPLLGPVDLANIQARVGAGVDVFSALEYDGDPDDDVQFGTATLDWVIVGGESGPGARPMHPDWVRSLRDQCNAAGVPFHFKQWGEWQPVTAKMILTRADAGGASLPLEIVRHGVSGPDQHVWKLGKKAAGRLLDGVEHNGFPGA